MKDNRADRLLRDKALHLYGDMVRFSLRQRWFSGLPTTRIEVYLLSRSVWPLTLVQSQLSMREFYCQLRWMERRFYHICRNSAKPYEHEQDVKGSIIQILKLAQADRYWREKHDPMRYSQRLDKQNAAREVKAIIGMSQQHSENYDTALSEAKKRLRQCHIEVKMTDDQYMAVLFLGQELANYYWQTINQSVDKNKDHS